MKPTTLEEALSMVPTHWMLTPGVDVWQDGDEEVFCSDYGPYWSDFLGDVGFEIPERNDALTVPIIARRPIPHDVRESAAWWLLHIHINDVSQSLTDELIEVLGGRERFKKEISAGPDPLGRWILVGKP